MMKRISVVLLSLLFAMAAQAQAEFADVDAMARSALKNGCPTPEDLAKALCKDLQTDRDKARALFTWLTENIRYDPDALGKDDPDAGSQKEYEDKLVKQAYRKGKGVCMHYALLYKRMADAAGLECVFIGGHSKGSVSGGWNTHAWNAVKVQGEWKLLDATWGAGYFDHGDDKFRQSFRPGYFFTPPRIFALNHFPNDEKWQLLETPIDKSTFKKQCSFDYGDPLHGISDAEPIGQPLTAGAEGMAVLRLRIGQPPPILQLRMGARDLPFERTGKDGWLTLCFPVSHGRELQIWGGRKSGKIVATTLMGIFPVR